MPSKLDFFSTHIKKTHTIMDNIRNINIHEMREMNIETHLTVCPVVTILVRVYIPPCQWHAFLLSLFPQWFHQWPGSWMDQILSGYHWFSALHSVSLQKQRRNTSYLNTMYHRFLMKVSSLKLKFKVFHSITNWTNIDLTQPLFSWP